MDREWFETRRRSVGRLQIATLVMMVVFFVFYFMVRSAGTELAVWGRHSARGLAAAARLAYLGPLAWATFIAFIGMGIKRQFMLAEYNKQILARDPKLVDEFVPRLR